MKVVENCTIVSDTLLGKKVKESGDCKYNYSRSLCHMLHSLWSFMMPGMNRIIDVGVYFYLNLDEQNIPLMQ